MTRRPLEICIDTIEGARTAAENGADRIELCAALSEGGLTPSAGLMDAAAKLLVPVYAMIRPRVGGFVYSDAEKALMLRDIKTAEQTGMAGIVIGAVTVQGGLDRPFLEAALSSTTLPATLHRAFDVLADFDKGVDEAVDLGFERILTSGGAVRAELGTEKLSAVVMRASGRISIMAGSGVSAANAAQILQQTSVGELHASCASVSQMPSPNAAESRLGFVPASGIRITDGGKVRALRAAMDQFKEAAA